MDLEYDFFASSNIAAVQEAVRSWSAAGWDIFKCGASSADDATSYWTYFVRQKKEKVTATHSPDTVSDAPTDAPTDGGADELDLPHRDGRGLRDARSGWDQVL